MKFERALRSARWAGAALTSCARPEPARAPYRPISELAAAYGPLIGAGNHPTPDQHGTGERIGLFQDPQGTVWGLPISIAQGGAVLACAPPMMRSSGITDTFPAGSIVIGATNAPTGWRGGTGDLELLLRDAHSEIRRRTVRARRLTGTPHAGLHSRPVRRSACIITG